MSATCQTNYFFEVFNLNHVNIAPLVFTFQRCLLKVFTEISIFETIRTFYTHKETAPSQRIQALKNNMNVEIWVIVA